jgi:hypothetical protein
MNTMIALMIVTATGVVEAPNNFNSMRECQAVVDKIKTTAYCVEKKPVDIDKQINMMFAIMSKMKSQMEQINNQQ